MDSSFPKLASSHFHLFGTVRDAISVKRFGSDDTIVVEVNKWPRIYSERRGEMLVLLAGASLLNLMEPV
jgi:hypothetical protein